MWLWRGCRRQGGDVVEALVGGERRCPRCHMALSTPRVSVIHDAHHARRGLPSNEVASSSLVGSSAWPRGGPRVATAHSQPRPQALLRLPSAAPASGIDCSRALLPQPPSPSAQLPAGRRRPRVGNTLASPAAARTLPEPNGAVSASRSSHECHRQDGAGRTAEGMEGWGHQRRCTLPSSLHSRHRSCRALYTTTLLTSHRLSLPSNPSSSFGLRTLLRLLATPLLYSSPLLRPPLPCRPPSFPRVPWCW